MICGQPNRLVDVHRVLSAVCSHALDLQCLGNLYVLVTWVTSRHQTPVRASSVVSTYVRRPSGVHEKASERLMKLATALTSMGTLLLPHARV